MLEEQPLGPFDVADILLAALDAHLHLRGLDTAANRQRGFTMSLRLGGSAAILGAILFLAGFVITSTDANQGVEKSPGAALILAGTALLLLALVGLSAFQARRHPRLIWAAFAIPAIGLTMMGIGIIAMATRGDGPFLAGLDPWSVWILGALATVVGSCLFGIATYRTGALPRPAAGLLAGGSALLLALAAPRWHGSRRHPRERRSRPHAGGPAGVHRGLGRHWAGPPSASSDRLSRPPSARRAPLRHRRDDDDGRPRRVLRSGCGRDLLTKETARVSRPARR